MGRMIRPARFAAAAAGSHTYWRLAFAGTDDLSSFSVGGIQMASTAGGADFAASASAITASVAAGGGSSLSNLTDGSQSTYYAASSGNCKGAWIKFQFATAKTLAELKIYPRNSGGSFYWQTPTIIFVAGSSDNSAWTTYALCIASTWTTSAQTFTIGSTALGQTKADARVWGVSVTGTQGPSTNASFAELIFASSVGGATLCTGGRGFHDTCINPSSTYGANASAFDGNSSTIWNGPWGSGAPTWTGYAFASAPSLPVEMRIQARPSFLGDSPSAFSIQWTTDGITYNTTDSYSGQSFTASQVKSYTIT